MPSEQTPNILFLFPDQLRFDWIGGAPGNPVRTPYLDQLRARGVAFSRAICPSPLCAPCRAALALGLEYRNSPVKDNRDNLPLNAPTVYRLLRDAGYHVMGCGKLDLNKGDCIAKKPAWGIDGKQHLAAWGFSEGVNNEGKMDGVNSGREKPQGPYLKYLDNRGLRRTHVEDFAKRNNTATFPTPLPDDAYCDNWIGRNGLALIDAAPKNKPWFLQVNYTGPHNPWDVTESMKALYAEATFPAPNARNDIPPDAHQEVRRNYSAMVENIDRWTGAFLDKLEARGELENTLIVFSSDHGEMLGDHNAWGKTHPEQPSVGVPLVIAGPGVQAGIQHDGPATILDLIATFLDAANVPVPENMDSRTLMPLLTRRTDRHRDAVVSALRTWKMAYDGRHKLILDAEKGDRFYDLQSDPLENADRLDDPAYAAQIEKLKKYL